MVIERPVDAGETVATDRLSTDEARLTRIYTENIARLTALACLLSGEAPAAEDLAQEVFVHVVRRSARDPDYLREPAWPYLRAVLLNLVMQRRRWLVRERLRLLRAAERPPDDWPQTTMDFVAALRSLPRRMRACAVLFYVEDLSRTEVASVLACSPRTVQTQLHEARRRLRDRLGPLEDG
jgi:RNA polymerase sigma factor (sigma-70 family)